MTPAHARIWLVGGLLLLAALAECSNATDPVRPAGASAKPIQPVGWRNDGSGRFPLATPPLEWSDTKNVVWSTKIGPNKFSSPIVVCGKVFVIADPALLVCVNASDGKILWQKSNGFADLPEKTEEKAARGPAGNTTPTPVSDGQYVYVVFGTGIVACYDMQGARKWIQHFNLKPATEYGRATSPVLADGKLLVTLSYLMAIDTKTGREIWKNKKVPELYGTPVVTKLDGNKVAVMPSGQIVRIDDGTILAADLGGLAYASPVVNDATEYLIQTDATAQQLGGAAGGKIAVKQLWEQELEGTFYASAVYDNGLIYAVSNENKFSILDAKDGKIVGSKDLEFAASNMYPSITLAGNHLFVFNDQGDALVLEPGKQYKELRRNHLGDGHGGTPAFDDKYIYLRSKQNLYCIGAK